MVRVVSPSSSRTQYSHFCQSSDTSEGKGSGDTRAATSAAENVKSFIAGGFGGVAAVLVGTYTWSQDAPYVLKRRIYTGHPFDLTKTRLQTAPPGVYTGGMDVVKKTVARDGITG